MLDYKKQIKKPFMSASLILLMALIGLFYLSYVYRQLDTMDEAIDTLRFDLISLENTHFKRLNTQSEQPNWLNQQAQQLIKGSNIDVTIKDKLSNILKENYQSSHGFSSIYTQLVQYKNQLKTQSHHILQKTLWMALTVLVIIIGIHFSGYRRTLELFEVAVNSKSEAEAFSYDAFHDALTQLPNRRYFNHHLATAIEHAKRSQENVVLLYMDLDGFKYVNDTHGHEIGDAVLIEVAQLLKPVLRASDFFARLGGDEFAIITHQTSENDDIQILTNRILGQFKQALVIDGIACQLGVSIGVATYPQHAQQLDTLISVADEAMYKAKKLGKNQAIFT